MNGLWICFKFSWRRIFPLFLSMVLLLMAFQILTVVVASSLKRSKSFEQLASMIPPFVREFVGPALPQLISFSGTILMGYFHMVTFAVHIGIAIVIGTEVAGETETRLLDFMMARPIHRTVPIYPSALLLLVCTTIAISGMWLSSTLALRFLAPADSPQIAFSVIRSLAVNLGFLMLSWGGLAMGWSARAKRRGAAGGAMALLAAASFILNLIAMSWRPAQKLDWISPFDYYDSFSLIMGKPIPMNHLLILSLFTLSGILVALHLFQKRDL